MIERIERWLAGYLAATEDQIHVLALWALHTWIFGQFDTTPYLVITSDGPGCGKSRAMELVGLLARNFQPTTQITPAALFTLIGMRNGQITLGFEEAEQLSAQSNPLRPLLNAGYRAGQLVTRIAKGGGTVDYVVYCPKIFVLIGDPTGTLRDRSIAIKLSKKQPGRSFTFAQAKGEALAITREIEARLQQISIVPIVEPLHLTERDREVWTPLFSVSALFKGDAARLARISGGIVMRKQTTVARSYRDVEAIKVDPMQAFAARLLRDCVAVLGEKDRLAIGTADLLARLRELPSGWESFCGTGLTDQALSDMLSSWSLAPRVCKIRGKAVRGYRTAELRAAGRTLTESVTTTYPSYRQPS